MTLIAVLAAAFLAAAQASEQQPDAAAPAPVESVYIEELERAVALAETGDCAGALDILLPALQSPDYASRLPDSAARAHETVVDCAIKERRWLDALASIEAHLALAGESERMLWFQLHVANLADRPLAGLAATERFVKREPRMLSEVELQVIFSLLGKLKDTPEGDKRLAFLDLLWDAGYKPADPAASLDGLRMAYARLLTAEHMTARAARLIREIDSSLAVTTFLIDRSFDPVRIFKGLPDEKDLPALVAAEVEKSLRATREHPALLAVSLNYIQALRLSGAFEDAEKAAAETAAAMGETAEESAYEDYDEYAAWILNEWAYSLYDLGRNDEARAALARAADKDEHGASNVSQRINLSSMLHAQERHAEALTEIAKLDASTMNPYGVMWAKAVTVCARAFQNRLGEASDDLAYLKEHKADNMSALQRTLFCVNDLDAAAALYIERLEDPDQRGAALNALQAALSPPYTPPVTAELHKRFETVRARPDVREAAEKVGRILSLPFYPTYWGDI